MVNKKDVSNFWSTHPLGSYEIREELGSPEFFNALGEVRRASSFFVMDFYNFSTLRGKRVLDVGCGPGWISHQYAEGGADIYSMDLTLTAAHLATRYFAQDHLNGRFVNADAERIPFQSERFDFVSCDGVLHHTPGTEKGLCEIHRVLKVNGRAAISFYYENILLRDRFFWLTKLILKMMRVKMHGVRELPMAVSREDFGKFYDGADNPLGKIYSSKHCADMLGGAGFKIVRSQVYFFPKRFFPLLRRMPFYLYRFCDQHFGTMIFFEVVKT